VYKTGGISVKKGTEKAVVGLTMGDAAGIGAEILVKAVCGGALSDDAAADLIGDRRQHEQGFRVTEKRFPLDVTERIEEAVESAAKNGIALLDTNDLDAEKIEFGNSSAVCGKNSADTMERAVQYCTEGFLDGFCFGPNNKAAMKRAGYDFTGMVDILAKFFRHTGPCGELNVIDNFFNARVTGHIPLKDVASALTSENILRTIRLCHDGLRRFGIDSPRIAVAALNPHAGEDGGCGTEEIEIITPAVNAARSERMDVDGPFAADTLFVRVFKRQYDAAVTMYHDQGQIAFKLRDFDNAVTFYAGLPFPVTTCAHGPAYGKAGKGTASPNAFIAAYKIVAQMALVAKRHQEFTWKS
jgi:4-hydroxythreonine-4-phosphate dehydrogenase